MAKQTGLYGIRGKVGEYKYYGMKGVDGTIMAKQNEGMSERVKTSPEYDNTRRNNFEFGMATSSAGAVTKAFSQKWRYLLVPFATAKVAKDLLSLGKIGSSNGWGDRVVNIQALNDSLATIMQKFVKNDINDVTPIVITATSGDEGYSLAANSEDFDYEKAKAAGCNGARVLLVHSTISPAEGGYSDRQIYGAACENIAIATADVDFGNDLTVSGDFTPSTNANLASVIVLPYRTIGSDKYIMQEFCTAKFSKVNPS